MALFQIMCQIGFLEKLFDEISVLANNFQDFLKDDTNEHSYLIQLYNLINKHSDVLIDYDFDQMEELSRKNPYFKALLKTNRLKPRLSDFDKLVNYELDYFQNLSQPSTLFFLNKKEADCLVLEQRYGYIFISNENIHKTKFLFNFLPQVFTKKQSNYSDWSFIKSFRHPFNSMVIADNYILKDSDLMKENLFPFLENFMPERLDENTFHLTILTLDVPNVKYRHEQITQHLEENFKYEVQLCIVIVADDPKKPGKPIHDRNVITNYFWLSSGYGFSIFKNSKVDKDTHLTLFSIFYPTNSPIPYNINNQKSLTGKYHMADMSLSLAKIFKEIQHNRKDTIGTVIYVIGSRQNRLLA